MKKTWGTFNKVTLLLGIGFLYFPIMFLIVFSFNDSKLVSVWGGFSTRWYTELFKNQGLIDAAWTSIYIAFFSATIATVLGTLAALALTRETMFRVHVLFSSMVFGVLMMPEIIMGLSFLLFFIALGIERGFYTVSIAHITVTMCFVAVIMKSCLESFDRSLEEAAIDLGATPMHAFFYITLPLIFPAVISAWFLAFTLSLDDLIIANFTSGPGTTTLPVKIYSQLRLGITPEINAVCVLFIVSITALVLLALLMNKKLEIWKK